MGRTQGALRLTGSRVAATVARMARSIALVLVFASGLALDDARGGQLEVLGTIATVPGTECVTTDERGHVYLCDPVHGRILVVADPYPANGHER